MPLYKIVHVSVKNLLKSNNFSLIIKSNNNFSDTINSFKDRVYKNLLFIDIYKLEFYNWPH